MTVRRRLVSLLTSGLIVGLLILYFLPSKAHAYIGGTRGPYLPFTTLYNGQLAVGIDGRPVQVNIWYPCNTTCGTIPQQRPSPPLTYAGWAPGGAYIRFGRDMTHRLAGKAQAGVGAFTGVFCGFIPAKPLPVIIAQGACQATVALYYLSMGSTFVHASNDRACVRVRWVAPSLAPISWHEERC